MTRLTVVLTSFGFAALLVLTGCAQQVGERCQIDSDCEGELVCAESIGRCQTAGSVECGTTDVPCRDGGFDAPLDSAEADATEVDAALAIDANELDAGIDAAPGAR